MSLVRMKRIVCLFSAIIIITTTTTTTINIIIITIQMSARSPAFRHCQFAEWLSELKCVHN
jgi:hypothetical protein